MTSMSFTQYEAKYLTRPSMSTNRRGIILVILTLFFLAGSAFPVQASEPTIVISSYEVKPEVIMPGGTGLITATVTNTAQKASLTTTSGSEDTGSVTETRDINAYLSDVYLFGNGLDVESGDYRRVGEVGPGQSLTLTFLVKAPYTSGIYFPELHIATQGGRSMKYPIPVNVNDDRLVQRNPALEVRKEFPNSIIPGDQANGRIILKNTGETAASEIFLNLSTEFREISLTTPGSIHIRRLASGDETTIDLGIITSREVTEGIHPVRCQIQYSSASGRMLTQTEELPFLVEGRSELSISAVSTDPVRVQEGDPFSLIIRVENTGTGDADGTKARIESNINGTKEAFIGKIEPDNDAPAIFYLQNAPPGDISIPVTVTTRNETVALQDSIEITVTGQPDSLIIPLLLVIILGAGGYFYWRRRGNMG